MDDDILPLQYLEGLMELGQGSVFHKTSLSEQKLEESMRVYGEGEIS